MNSGNDIINNLELKNAMREQYIRENGMPEGTVTCSNTSDWEEQEKEKNEKPKSFRENFKLDRKGKLRFK